MIEVEICVADPGGVAAAVAGGAHRVELCTALELGGLTPSIGAVELAHEQARGAFVTALIRARAGDFVYDGQEADVMVRDVKALGRWADQLDWADLGFTIGALLPTGEVDQPLTAWLVEAAGGRRIVFNKAFDSVPEPMAALEVLHRLGVEGVLTSGGGGACLNNLDSLRQLAAASPLAVTAAGGVRPGNVALVAATGVPRVHLRAPAQVTTLSHIASEYDQPAREVTDTRLVAETLANLGRL